MPLLDYFLIGEGAFFASAPVHNNLHFMSPSTSKDHWMGIKLFAIMADA
jgi:hypothetical protein